MTILTTPIQIGSLTLRNRIFYAPLAGCSDFPFRKMSALYHPGLMYCEMVKMDALVRFDSGTFHLLDYSPDMHPIGGQLCGSNPSIAGQAARMIEEAGFDVLDLNCGCPVDKITKDGSGSAMLKTPELIGDVIANMCAKVKIPVTVKIRAGWDDDTINAASIVKIAEEAGAKAICIHGRTREQGYKGPANWDYIKQAKQAANHIIVIGNGDVVDGPSAEAMVKHTGCDAVLIGRATMGQPWIVQTIVDYFLKGSFDEKSLEDCRQVLHQHFIETKNYQNDRHICLDMRRVGCWYLKKSSGTRHFRELISRAKSVHEVEELISNFPLGDFVSEES